MFLVKKEDPYYLDGISALDQANRWRYYIASYTSVEDTDGVDKKALSPVLLLRNLHALGADAKSERFPAIHTSAEEVLSGEGANGQESNAVIDNEGNSVGDRLLQRFLAAKNDERLIMRIAVNNYHAIFQPGTAEGFFEDLRQREGGEEGVKEAEECRIWRDETVREKFVMNNDAMKGLSKEEVEKKNAAFVEVVDGLNIQEEMEKKKGDDEGEKMEVD
jgi:paired amphipathic helix protein Sin3a